MPACDSFWVKTLHNERKAKIIQNISVFAAMSYLDRDSYGISAKNDPKLSKNDEKTNVL